MQVTRHHSCRVSPFGHPRINARLTAPRGISQPPTSFIGSQCQGIHHAPLNTYNTKKPKTENQKNYTTTNHTPDPPQKDSPAHVRLDARNHYPQIKHHTPPPKPARQQHTSHPTQGPGNHGPVVSGPNSVLDDFLSRPTLPSRPQ